MFFQRTDPFNVMIKNYEKKQDEMLKKQIDRCKKEMEYWPQKMKENLHEDTSAMVKLMRRRLVGGDMGDTSLKFGEWR